MRVFREVVPQKKKETQPAVRYQEALIEKRAEPTAPMPPRILQPRYTPGEYRSLYKKKNRSWKAYYVFVALVLICVGVVYLTFFSEGAGQAMTERNLLRQSATLLSSQKSPHQPQRRYRKRVPYK